jgi:hypothetical protein
MRVVRFCQIALLGLALVPLSAGASRTELPARADNKTVTPWSEPAALRWLAVARELVRKNLVDPLWAARTYALVSVAQYDAVSNVSQFASQTKSDAILIEAAVAVSSATTLAQLYPHEVPRISGHFDLHLQELRKRTSSNVALDAAIAASKATTLSLLRRRDGDGATRLEIVTPPPGDRVWYSSEQWSPLRPYWGEVQPFLITQLSDYDPPAPPAPGSAESNRALAAVREARRAASSYNEGIAKKWADGPGTSTPVGHWNEIAATLIERYRLGNVESARVLAFMNMALMDVSILCWRTKFKYWQMRPSQVDKTIVPSFPIPNFPSYPSGHAAFSAAAATFLGHRFPDEKQELIRQAEEAAQSRVVSGLHYPFDCDAGLWQGRRVAETAIALYERSGQVSLK